MRYTRLPATLRKLKLQSAGSEWDAATAGSVTTCARNAKTTVQIGHSARPDKPLGCREYSKDIVELNGVFGNAYSTFLLAVSEIR